MNYLNIIRFDTGNAPGLSTTVFIAGCSHPECINEHCDGCHNPASWNFEGGQKLDLNVLNEISKSLDNPFVKNFVVSGGEPLHERNIHGVSSLIQKIKAEYPDKYIWIYTGYKMQDLMQKEFFVDNIIPYVDYIIDGPYLKEFATKNLQYRGSTNQHIYQFNKGEIKDITETFYKESRF